MTAPATWLGHRAIGVPYDPKGERGNYVPTRMGDRYDALIWLEETSAVRPVRHEAPPRQPEFETEPPVSRALRRTPLARKLRGLRP